MEQPNSTTNPSWSSSPSSSVRVLIRPSSSSPSNRAASPTSFPFPTLPNPPQYPPSLPPTLPPNSPSSSSDGDGVVVVGFLGTRSTADVTHLINRILDSNVFGSGNLDKDLPTSHGDGPRISYYHEPDKGLVFLHLKISRGCSSTLEQCEANDIQGMLFMFSVCHVIIFVHNGFRLDTQILKKFRILQAAKHALAPFVRSQVTPMLASKSSSSISQPISPPIRASGTANRHAPAISLMSNSGSRPSTLPGQCTPVILFVFSDDFSDGFIPAPDSQDTLKGLGYVARPISKTESNFRKRLNSSLEAQIRFLIKKCRILAGTESGNAGSRGIGYVISLPLFSLDSSRIVALLERSTNQRGEALEFIAGLVDEHFDPKEATDMSLFGNQCQTLNNEDVQLIKDFIYRQSDNVRGRVGPSGNSNSSSVAGVGMVAAAAAAAAASAAAGKLVSAPELPSLENWMSSSNLILNALTSVEQCFTDEIGNIGRLPPKRSTNMTENEQISRLGISDTTAAFACLESSKRLNVKFSTSWCQRALPAAREVYLKDLPASYPTAVHKIQLEKALHAFHSSVRGPAVQTFTEKLEKECTSIWESGRQLCDAVSLTGKPCMHRRHNVGDVSSSDVSKQHASGYVFLHACACGRSRRLRDDPFDFYSANTAFNHFGSCHNLLPNLVFPKRSNGGPLLPFSWSLLRLGGARYYKQSKGLLQVGFSSTGKFLSKWTISVEGQQGPSVLPTGLARKCPNINSTTDTKAASPVDNEGKQSETASFTGEVQDGEVENQRKSSDMVTVADTNISFGKGLPYFTLKKPFSEVVAGNIVVDSAFPVLQHGKQPKTTLGKGARQAEVGEQTDNRMHVADGRQGSKRVEHVTFQENLHRPETKSHTNADPILQIGSNIVPINPRGSEKIKSSNSLKQVVVYVGFEHECSYGHRFLLSLEHLTELGSSYSLSEKSGASTEASARKGIKPKNGFLGNSLPRSSTATTLAINNMKGSNGTEADINYQQTNKFTLFPRSGMGNFQSVNGPSVASCSAEELRGSLSHVRLDDGGSAFSLLNRNLPIYMDCPYCRNSTKHQNIKFASTVSQLQRIFLVTPPFPTVLATCPVIQFEESCLPQSISSREQQSRFSIGSRVILPPESFLTLRLPFVYGVQMDDGSLHPLNHLQSQPELSAWLVKCTALQVVSMGHEFDEEFR